MLTQPDGNLYHNALYIFISSNNKIYNDEKYNQTIKMKKENIKSNWKSKRYFVENQAFDTYTCTKTHTHTHSNTYIRSIRP